MLDQGVPTDQGDDGFVPFYEAGTAAKGQFHCADCGYGVTVQSRLPACPMCAGRSWEQSAWSAAGRVWPL
jgi:hypothetical protein